jgi:hypothetical protein
MAFLCGHVYVLYSNVAEKEKLIVPAYVFGEGKVRAFLINTDLSAFVFTTPELARHALPLKRDANKKFLTHDSWLCCNEVIGGWSAKEIEENASAYRGPIDTPTLGAVRVLIEGSRLYSDKEKALIISQWPQ